MENELYIGLAMFLIGGVIVTIGAYFRDRTQYTSLIFGVYFGSILFWIGGNKIINYQLSRDYTEVKTADEVIKSQLNDALDSLVNKNENAIIEVIKISNSDMSKKIDFTSNIDIVHSTHNRLAVVGYFEDGKIKITKINGEGSTKNRFSGLVEKGALDDK